jgi:RHS repeat-associated protein
MFVAAPFGAVQEARGSQSLLAAVEVVGQSDFASTSYDTFSYVTATALDTAHHRLFVADSNNNRVFVFALNADNTLARTTPSHVLGTDDSGSPSEIYTPEGLAYDAKNNRLFVSQFDANSILVFDLSGGLTDGMDASFILGQPDFGSYDPHLSRSGLDLPSGLAFDPKSGFLYVADTANNRVLIFDARPGRIANGANALGVLGQSRFDRTQTCCTGPTWLHWPVSLALDLLHHRLFVGDTDENRVVVYNTAALRNYADHELGQPSIYSHYGPLVNASSFAPYGLSYDPVRQRLFVEDGAANRILVFDAASITDGEDAVEVIGQPDFTTGGQACYIADAASLCLPNGSSDAYDPALNLLYVSDTRDQRVLAFQPTYGFVGPQPGHFPSSLYNAAAPGACNCAQLAGDPVDGGSGDFHETTTDASVATNGPPLSFTRTYAASLAQAQSVSGAPGRLGYGWTDSLDMSLMPGQAVSGGAYTIPAGGLGAPSSVAVDSDGDTYIADTANCRVQEIAATTHTQWGTSMTAGDVYTVAGDATGTCGYSGDNGPAGSALFQAPSAVAVDSSGNVYVADEDAGVVREIAATSHTQWGIEMSEGDIYRIAGDPAQASTHGGNGGPATEAGLAEPQAIALDSGGNLYIADYANNRVQEVAAATQTQWGVAMTAAYVYTIAGSDSAVAGDSGSGGASTLALLDGPIGVALDRSDNVYIADTGNNRIQEIAASTGDQWGQAMTASDIYTIAGPRSGGASNDGSSGDGGPTIYALLAAPTAVALDPAGDVYVVDSGNGEIRELAVSSGTQWGQAMNAGYIYTVAGSAGAGTGSSGDGGPATAAQFNFHSNANDGIAVAPDGDLYVADPGNDRVRAVIVGTKATLPLDPAPASATVKQANGAEVTFMPPVAGSCVAPYVGSGAAGTYCASAEVTASLTYDNASGTYSFVTHPYERDTFDGTGRLIGESGPGDASLSIAYDTPAPGSGACPSFADSCETVTSASGRTLVIASSSNRITTVTDPLGRTWRYSYCSPTDAACSTGDLISVTDPRGKVTSFEYDATNSNSELVHDLLTVTKPNGQPGGSHEGAKLVNAYNGDGQVTSQTDPNGNRTTFDYANLDTATGSGWTFVTDPDNSTTELVFSGGVLMSKVEGYNSSTPADWSYEPDPDTLLDTSIVDPNGNKTSYTYDAFGNTIATMNPLGSRWTSSYNSFDEQVCSTTPLAESGCASLTPPAAVTAGASTVSPPDSVPPAFVTYSQYDTDGNPVWTTTGDYAPGATEPTPSRTKYNLYSGQSITLGGAPDSCSLTPPSSSLPCATINANGVATQFGYNSHGDLTSSETPDGNTGVEVAKTTYDYDADGELTSLTEPNGNLSGSSAADFTTTRKYDDAGNLHNVTVSHTGGEITARTTSYEYDDEDNPILVTNPRGKETHSAYDANDQRTLSTDPDGQSTLTCYDGDGNVAQTVPPAGVEANSLTPDSCPTDFPSSYGDQLANESTTFTYDALGNQTEMTTPSPASQWTETTTYTYDPAGQLLMVSAPATSNDYGDQITQYAYDAAGELSTKTVGWGTEAEATTVYCYDPGGRQTASVPGDGNVDYTEDCTYGSLPYTTDSPFQTLFAYDSLGELVSRTRPATAAAPDGQTATMTYDPAGNLLTSVDPNGVTTTMSYTPRNQLASVDYSGSSAASVTYTYDANGHRVAMTDGTGDSSFSYDTFGELTSHENDAGLAATYKYNRDGEVSDITYPLGADATWADTHTVSYGYDDAGELNAVTDFNGRTITVSNTRDALPDTLALGSTGDTITTSYDQADTPSEIAFADGSGAPLLDFAYTKVPDGAIESETVTPSTDTSPATYTYDGQNRVTQMTPGTQSPLAYTFDDSGNPTTLPTGAAATYDQASELTHAEGGGNASDYTYDADGQRTQETQGATTTVAAAYNGARELTAYSNADADLSSASYQGDGMRASTTATPTGGSATDEAFVWNQASRVPQLLMDSDNAYVYGPGHTPIEQVDLSTGEVSYLVADVLGSVRGIVGASGDLIASTSYDAWGNPQTTGGLSAYTPFGFAGGYTDATGLVYLINRYYDPKTGQFISLDPLVNQTEAAYAYVGDDPVNVFDLTGLGCSWYDIPCQIQSHAGTISTVSMAVAVVAAPIPVVGEFVAPIAGAISFGTGLIATAQSLSDNVSSGNWTGVGFDALGLVPVFGGELRVARCAAIEERAAERGGLNLYKWKDPTSTRASGWREGDRLLTVPWKGSSKATWAENASRLRREMRSGEPIYETYVDSAGNQIRTEGFLNAERNLLSNHGWEYDPGTRAWTPPR